MADIACHYGIPSVLYWIQPATIFAIYHHYFHSYGGVIASHVCDPCFEVAVPGIPPLRIRELPSLLTITVPDDPYTSIFESLQEIFSFLDRQKSGAKPRVLINTFDELEADALADVSEVKLIAVGPVRAPELISSSRTRSGTWSGWTRGRRSRWCTCRSGAWR
ncbi:unnamed protein product [Musa banksii]